MAAHAALWRRHSVQDRGRARVLWPACVYLGVGPGERHQRAADSSKRRSLGVNDKRVLSRMTVGANPLAVCNQIYSSYELADIYLDVPPKTDRIGIVKKANFTGLDSEANDPKKRDIIGDCAISNNVSRQRQTDAIRRLVN